MAPRPLEELSPPELEALWAQAKKKLADVEKRGADIRHSPIAGAKP